tara:strand:- start:430 stop:720 length:291 start_codon:yes stop_codon:yes gene_type:complete
MDEKKDYSMYTLSEIEKVMKESPESLVGETPTHYISGSGTAWYLDPTARSMKLVMRGANIVTSPNYVDSKNRVLAYFIDGKVLLVPREEIIELGYM